MAEKPKTPEEIFNDDSDDDQFIDAMEKEGNEGRSGDFDVEKEKIEGDDRVCGAHCTGESNGDEDNLVGPEHEVIDHLYSVCNDLSRLISHRI